MTISDFLASVTPEEITAELELESPLEMTAFIMESWSSDPEPLERFTEAFLSKGVVLYSVWLAASKIPEQAINRIWSGAGAERYRLKGLKPTDGNGLRLRELKQLLTIVGQDVGETEDIILKAKGQYPDQMRVALSKSMPPYPAIYFMNRNILEANPWGLKEAFEECSIVGVRGYYISSLHSEAVPVEKIGWSNGTDHLDLSTKRKLKLATLRTIYNEWKHACKNVESMDLTAEGFGEKVAKRTVAMNLLLQKVRQDLE